MANSYAEHTQENVSDKIRTHTTSESIQERETRRFRYAAATKQGRCHEIEDEVLVADFGNGIYVFGIFDGGGGPWIARYCKDNFASTLKNQASFKHGDYTSALKDAFLAIDKSLLGDAFKTTFLSSKFDEKTRDATLTHSYMNTSSTALVCLIVETTIYIANAGDSKAIVFYKESTTKPHKTTEHTLLNRAEDARVIRLGGSTITYAGYRYVWSGCAMLMSTRCIGQETLSCDLFSLPKGMHAFKSNTTKPASDQIVIASPDVYTYELSEIKFIVLASDGVWDGIGTNTIDRHVTDRLQDLSSTIGEVLVYCGSDVNKRVETPTECTETTSYPVSGDESAYVVTKPPKKPKRRSTDDMSIILIVPT